MIFSYSNDLLKGILIFLACATVSLFDPSKFYHSIRSQSTIKLYVIFNVIEVLDKLFSSFGLDVLDAFFSKPPVDKLVLYPLIHFSLCALYISKQTIANYSLKFIYIYLSLIWSVFIFSRAHFGLTLSGDYFKCGREFLHKFGAFLASFESIHGIKIFSF